MRFEKIISSFLVVLVLGTLVSCGQDSVCVMGVGKCDIPAELANKKQTGTTVQGAKATGPLKGSFQTDNYSIGLTHGHRIILVGSGGKPPYKFTMVTGPETGSVTEADGVFTAGEKLGIAKVKVTDSGNQAIEMQIDIQ